MSIRSIHLSKFCSKTQWMEKLEIDKNMSVDLIHITSLLIFLHSSDGYHIFREFIFLKAGRPLPREQSSMVAGWEGR